MYVFFWARPPHQGLLVLDTFYMNAIAPLYHLDCNRHNFLFSSFDVCSVLLLPLTVTSRLFQKQGQNWTYVDMLKKGNCQEALGLSHGLVLRLVCTPQSARSPIKTPEHVYSLNCCTFKTIFSKPKHLKEK